MYPADTNYAQETVESFLYWRTFNQDISYLLAYDVFGDAYVGDNDFSTLFLANPAITGINLYGTYPGPGTFDN